MYVKKRNFPAAKYCFFHIFPDCRLVIYPIRDYNNQDIILI